MDNIFLKEIAESYEIDKDLQNKQEVVFNYLVNTRSYLKDNYPEIYEDINYNTSKLNQQKLFYSLLDDVVTEDISTILGTVATVMALTGLYNLFDKTDHYLAGLFTSMQTIHNRLRNYLKDSKTNKFSKDNAERYQIVDKMLDSQYSNCYKMCGTEDSTKIGKDDRTGYMKALFQPGERHRLLGPKEAADAQCLVGCYLDFMTSSIAELNLLYKQCMQKTGELSREPDVMKATVPIGSQCDQLRQDTNELKTEFDRFLKHLYKNNPRSHATWVEILNKKTEDALAGKRITTYGPLQVQSDLQTRQHLGL